MVGVVDEGGVVCLWRVVYGGIVLELLVEDDRGVGFVEDWDCFFWLFDVIFWSL